MHVIHAGLLYFSCSNTLCCMLEEPPCAPIHALHALLLFFIIIGKSTCGGAVSSVIVTDLTPSGFPATITTVKKCTWLLLKPANRRELRVSFAYFDVIGNAACSDNRVEVFDGFSRRLASLCTTTASQRSFTLRSSFSYLKLIVINPRNFRGFHAKLLLV